MTDSDSFSSDARISTMPLGLPLIFAAIIAMLSWVVPTQNEQSFEAVPGKTELVYGDLPTSSGLVSLPTGLWGDPFEQRATARELLKKDLQRENVDGSPSQTLQNMLKFCFGKQAKRTETGQRSDRYSKILKSEPLLVMPIIVAGESDKASIRDRLKYRHATEHALAQANFRMEFSGRMSYCLVRNLESTHSPSTARIVHDACVPIKLYRKVEGSVEDEEEPKRILVCWIDQRHLGMKPVGMIQQIVEGVLEIDSAENKKFDISVIGPKFSETLKKISEEPMQIEPWVDSFRIYSPSATVKNEVGEADRFRVVPGIGNNDALSSRIISELRCRRRLRGSMVVFQQANATSPQDMYDKLKGELDGKQQKDELDGKRPNIIVLRYLKGFGSSQNKSRDSRTDDYLLRKVNSMSIEGSINRFDVATVGFLGNEIEDKIALIKTARSIFPNATFFTTDMYREYLLPENLPYTRGLLVATHYRLSEPNVDKKKDVELEPISFRDSYQASVYKSILKACDNEDTSELPLPSKLVEIGFTGPVILDAPDTKSPKFIFKTILSVFSLKVLLSVCFVIAALFLSGPLVWRYFITCWPRSVSADESGERQVESEPPTNEDGQTVETEEEAIERQDLIEEACENYFCAA